MFLCPWDFPGKNTGVGCHYLFQGIFLTQGLNLSFLHFLHWQTESLPRKPNNMYAFSAQFKISPIWYKQYETVQSRSILISFFLNTENHFRIRDKRKTLLSFVEFIQVYYLLLPCGIVISALGKMMKDKNWAQRMLTKQGQICFSRLWKIENRFWREYNGRFVWFFFPLLNMTVELVVGMWCQFNSESCFSFSWKPHRIFWKVAKFLYSETRRQRKPVHPIHM